MSSSSGSLDRPAAVVGAWTPLRERIFRGLWLASVGSNIGTWLQSVAAGWEMTNLSSSPLMVALVQVALTLPAFALAILAGALADIVDRRSILIWTQVAGSVIAVVLALTTAAGQLNALALLLLTFLMGIQSALQTPAWAANTADIVPRAQLPAAVALGSLSFNISRAVGPALGGAILSFAHPAVAFAANALSFVGVLVVLLRWRRKRPPPQLAPEGLVAAMRSGVRFVREEPTFRALLVRCAAFSVPGAAVFALMPLIGRGSTLASANGYAFLLAAIGGGAVAAALVLPRIRAQRSRDAVALGAGLLFFVALAVAAATRNFWLLLAAMPLAGAGWLSTLSTLQISAQTISPGWVRARALAIYFMTLNGAVALGGTLWGALAAQASVQVALGAAAVTMLASLTMRRWFPITAAETADPTPAAAPRLSGEQPGPHVVDVVPHDAGPVLVQIEYDVRDDFRLAFIAEMRELGRIRRRDGAYAWECSFDIRSRNQAVETFQVESWLEHLRQHERIGPQMRRVQERIRGLCLTPPRSRHFVSITAGALDLSPHPPVAAE